MEHMPLHPSVVSPSGMVTEYTINLGDGSRAILEWQVPGVWRLSIESAEHPAVDRGLFGTPRDIQDVLLHEYWLKRDRAPLERS